MRRRCDIILGFSKAGRSKKKCKQSKQSRRLQSRRFRIWTSSPCHCHQCFPCRIVFCCLSKERPEIHTLQIQPFFLKPWSACLHACSHVQLQSGVFSKIGHSGTVNLYKEGSTSTYCRKFLESTVEPPAAFDCSYKSEGSSSGRIYTT